MLLLLLLISSRFFLGRLFFIGGLLNFLLALQLFATFLLLLLLVLSLLRGKTILRHQVFLLFLLFFSWRFGSFLGWESTSNFHVDLLDDVLVLIHFSGSELACLSDLYDLVVSQADHDVLGLEVCVNNLAHAMHVVKTNEALTSKLSHKRHRDSFVIIALYDLEEVNA